MAADQSKNDTVNTIADDDDDFKVKNNFSWKPIIIRTAIAFFVITTLIVTYIVGSISGSKNADTSQPTQVEAIKSQNKVLDSLESLKDSQIRSMTKDVNDLQVSGGSNSSSDDSGKPRDPMEDNTKMIADSSKLINKYIETFYGLGYNPNPNDVNSTVTALSQLQGSLGGSGSGATSKSARAVVDGASPAKDVKATGKKAGPATIVLVGSNGGAKVFVVFAPFATEHSLTQTVSVVKADGQSVQDYRYIGSVSGTDPGRLDQAIADFKIS